jgi:tRNA threonylcarbamoyl adenosine modification protein (Sua5/YciO/YrdC/YwlC family)
MSLLFKMHPDNPQLRLIRKAADLVRTGGLIVYPTDTSYALGCPLGDKAALKRICTIRQLDEKHHFTLVCRDLSEISAYARFDTPVYRLLKAHTPGAYTFVLPATREVPRRLMHPKHNTIGLRIPNHRLVQALLVELNQPMLTTTLILPGERLPLSDPSDIVRRLWSQVDLVLDAGFGGLDVTTLVDLTESPPKILRIGKGNPAPFESDRRP